MSRPAAGCSTPDDSRAVGTIQLPAAPVPLVAFGPVGGQPTAPPDRADPAWRTLIGMTAQRHERTAPRCRSACMENPTPGTGLLET